MEYKKTHYAKFSNSYVLVIVEDDAGTWRIRINGPRPISGLLESVNLADAKSEAYSVADGYFVKIGIVELTIPREKIVWVAHP